MLSFLLEDNKLMKLLIWSLANFQGQMG